MKNKEKMAIMELITNLNLEYTNVSIGARERRSNKLHEDIIVIYDCHTRVIRELVKNGYHVYMSEKFGGLVVGKKLHKELVEELERDTEDNDFEVVVAPGNVGGVDNFDNLSMSRNGVDLTVDNRTGKKLKVSFERHEHEPFILAIVEEEEDGDNS